MAIYGWCTKIYLLKMAIFRSYVGLPEGMDSIVHPKVANIAKNKNRSPLP